MKCLDIWISLELSWHHLYYMQSLEATCKEQNIFSPSSYVCTCKKKKNQKKSMNACSVNQVNFIIVLLKDNVKHTLVIISETK